MDRTILISVLMAVYNTKVEYLDEAVQSILKQTYTNLEIIVIDDASTDLGTVNYLKGIEDTRVRVYRNQENMGLTKSLNVGLDLCHGRYIARQDSDDISEPTRLEDQLKCLKANKCFLVGCLGYEFPPPKRIATYSYWNSGYSIAMIFGNKGPLHSSFFIDHVQMKESRIKYNERFITSQDYGLLCESLAKGKKIGVCNKTLVGYRKHAAQISTARRYEQIADAERIRLEYIRSRFVLSTRDLIVFKDINDNTYERDVNPNLIQNTLRSFIDNNSAQHVSQEVYRYWFRQSLLRLCSSRRSDFIKTKLFFESLRPDRLFYIVANYIREVIQIR